MTAIVLPDIDRSTIDELKKRIPNLSEIELTLPSRKDVSRTAKDVGKSADETIDRLLGRKRMPIWPWIAAGLGLAAVIGVVAAWFAWFRRPAWQSTSEPIESDAIDSEPWSATADEVGQVSVAEPTAPAFDDEPVSVVTPTRSRSTASKSATSPASATPYPIEEA